MLTMCPKIYVKFSAFLSMHWVNEYTYYIEFT